MTRELCVVAALVLGSGGALARPVSYEGGWTAIEETDRQSTAALIHYTPDPAFSIGVRTEWDRRDDILFSGVQATWLARRWFGEGHQANLYVWGAAGAATGVGNNPGGSEPAAMVGVMADFETRRFMVAYRAAAIEAGDLDATAMQAAHFGIAPYVADSGAVHAWLMVEIDHRPDNDEPIGVIPMIRLFRGSALFEAGWSVTDDQPVVNFTYRF